MCAAFSAAVTFPPASQPQVWPSYNHVFSVSGPDAVFMSEQWQLPPGGHTGGYINLFNTGVYAMRSNARTLAFMDLWWVWRHHRSCGCEQCRVWSFIHVPDAFIVML
eukprot:362759-Chlamydomonas_euryale.AAC.3